MTLLNLAPTRSNLLALKSQLSFAQEGYEILDKKREVITIELLRMSREAEAQQAKVMALMEDAYRKLELARMTMGEEKVEWAAESTPQQFEISVLQYGMMGVPLPRIRASGQIKQMTHSLSATTVPLDGARMAFSAVLLELPALAELEIGVRRLARELKRTQRRVNALQRIFIPNYTETIKFMEASLEEQEREEVFKLQWLSKERLI